MPSDNPVPSDSLDPKFFGTLALILRGIVYQVSRVINKCHVLQVPKGGVEIKPAQVKQHLFLFINALVENPAFDSQTKENMTLKKRESRDLIVT